MRRGKCIYNSADERLGLPHEKAMTVPLRDSTREIRVPRVVGDFPSGRSMNTRTAHSRDIGGMIWGIDPTLHAETEIDTNAARDVIDAAVVMVPEVDTLLGPPGIVGTSAALANVAQHASSQRLRELPLRIDELVAGA